MSAYYAWVNATKMEHLGNGPFACSVGIMENCRFPNDRTDVALTLLAGRWHGNLVAFVSDYTHLEERVGEGFRRMAGLIPENPRDYVEKNGYDVGSLFSCFKEAEWYFPTEDDPEAESCTPTRGRLTRSPSSTATWQTRPARGVRRWFHFKPSRHSFAWPCLRSPHTSERGAPRLA